jgi:DNA-directed RNA polymerase specialized sigma24 family protein
MDDSGPKPEASSVYMKIFEARYNKLLKAASLLAGIDRGQAVDLVHDALLVFVHRSPDLCKINNLDGYLRRLMYNLFKSQKRRAAFRSVNEFSVDNYDSVEYVLHEIADRCHNPHLLLQMQDALRAVCEYACFRKERLKIGSALLLRFFHGYHTGEIAQIMGVTPGAVSHQLKLAHSEISLYFNDPTNANFYRDIAGARSEYGLN